MLQLRNVTNPLAGFKGPTSNEREGRKQGEKGGEMEGVFASS